MKNRSIDPWLILTSTLLIVFGLIMVYSASAMKASGWLGGTSSGEEVGLLTAK